MSVFFVNMKNCYSLCVALFCLTSIFSQEKLSFDVFGTILSDSVAIENVHVLNKTQLTGVVSTSFGRFKLPVSIGDTLFFSHINFENKEYVIVNTKQIKINLIQKTHTLNEVTLVKKRGTFYIDPEIIPASELHKTRLKLPFTLNKGYTENKSTLRTESGVVVNIVSLINSLNGKRKKEKELKNAKIRDQKFDTFRAKFSNSFFVYQLKIKEEYINQFIEYCFLDGALDHLKNNNLINLTHILIEKSNTFPFKTIDQDTLLTKH